MRLMVPTALVEDAPAFQAWLDGEGYTEWNVVAKDREGWTLLDVR